MAARTPVRLLALLVVLVSFLPSVARAQSLVWVRQFGASPNDRAWDAVADASGAFVVGETSGALGGQTPPGNGDAFIQRYTGGGALQWTRLWGTGRGDYGTGVATAQSSLFIGGLTWNRKTDAFIASYTVDGDLRWSTTFGSKSYDAETSIAANHTGVYATAVIGGSPQGGLSDRGHDVLLRRYTLGGKVLWTRRIGTPQEEYGARVALDGKGHLYVSGATEGAFRSHTNAGGTDVFVQKYDRDGNLRWTREFGTRAGDWPGGSAASPKGLYVSGYTERSLTGAPNAGRTDAFLAKIGRRGARAWTSQIGTSEDDRAYDVSLAGRRLFLGGFTEGTFKGQANAGLTDAFLGVYRLDGMREGLTQFGSPDDDYAFGVGASSGRSFLVGYTLGVFEGQAPHGPPTDAFVSKIT